MFHERMLLSSPLVTMPSDIARGGFSSSSMLEIAREAGRVDDPVARDLVGEARMLAIVREELHRRVGEGVLTGAMSDQAAAIGRLFHGFASTRTTTIVFQLAGAAAAAWTDDDDALAGTGNDFLLRQVSCIGGGTTEMARNVISERVLGMPREASGDKGVAFREVPRGPKCG
jgi:alkylation response protein AidB-like acyl-CoA dehydrogenase